MFNNINFSALTLSDIIDFSHSVAFLKWVLMLFVIFYFVYIFITFRQVNLMNKVITQQSSSTIIFIVTVIFFLATIGIFIFVLRL